MISVLVADTQRLFGEALVAWLVGNPDFEVAHELPATGAATLEVALKRRPDVVVMDCWLPDVQAASIIRTIRTRLPDCKAIVVSGFYSPQHIDETLLAGAVGFLPKSIGLAELADAIRQAHAGVYPVDRDRLAQLRTTLDQRADFARDLEERFSTLTPREIQVLTLLNHGRSTDEIADELDISPRTVAHHVQAVLDKTGAGTRTGALILARNVGFLPPVPSGWVRDT